MSNINNGLLLLILFSFPLMPMEDIDGFTLETIKLVSRDNTEFHLEVCRQNIIDLFGENFAQYILSREKKFLGLPNHIVKIIADILCYTHENNFKKLKKMDKETFLAVVHFFRDHSSSEIGGYLPFELNNEPPKEIITPAYLWNRLKFFIRTGKYKVIYNI